MLQLQQLVDAANAVECLTNHDKRQMVIEAMKGQLGDEVFQPSQFPDARAAIYSLIHVCRELDAFQELIQVTKMIGGSTRDWYKLNQQVGDLFKLDVILATERNAIQDHLLTLSRAILIEILASPMLEGRIVHTSLDPFNAVTTLHQLELLANETGADQYVLAFLELSAHRLSGRAFDEVHKTIDGIARRRGLVLEVSQMCRRAVVDRPDPPDTTNEYSPGTSDSPDTVIKDPVSGEPDPEEEEEVKSTSAQTGSQDPRVAVAPAVWGGVPPRNKYFTGRGDLLDEIRRLLRQRTQTTVLPQALAGLGGVGKSQIAIEYVYRYNTDYDLVWWVPADEDRAITRSLVSLARRLGLPESHDAQHTVNTVLEELRLGNPTPKWLLIFDNAGSPSRLQRFLPPGPGRVLVTSRDRSWERASDTVNVDVFTPPESMSLLRRRWPELTEEQALILAEQLGHLPLALEQAAALHAETGMPLDEYLRNLQAAPSRTLDESAVSDDDDDEGYRQSVARMFSLAYQQLVERSPAAAQLLELCAFLSSSPISIQMLIRGGRRATLPEPLRSAVRDDIPLRRAVRNLTKFALAQLDASLDLITVHMLVRAVMRDGLTPQEQDVMRRAAHSVLASANPAEPDDPTTWPQHAQIAPHILPSGIISSDGAEERQIVLDQIRYLYQTGDYAASEVLAKAVVEEWSRRFPPDDAVTLVASRHWADSLRALGFRQEALRINRRTLERMRGTLGNDHEHTLATARGYGADLRLQGLFEEAKELDEATLEDFKEVLGEDDRATLRSANSLALDLRLLGDFESSSALQRDILTRSLASRGEEHPETLLAYTNLCRDYYGLGHYADGLDLQAAKLAVLKKIGLGPGHTWVLLAQRFYVMLLRRCGNLEEAVHQAQEHYRDCQKYLRHNHDLWLAAAVTLCNALRAVGDLEQAKSVGAEALEGYREGFGPDHPFSLACANDYAIVLRGLGKHDEATALDETTYAKLKEKLGERHPQTLCSASGRAANLAAAGRISEALATSQYVYDLSREVRRPDHPMTLACASNLVLDLAAAKRHSEAAELKEDTLERLRRQLGLQHPDVVNAERGRRAEADIEIPPT